MDDGEYYPEAEEEEYEEYEEDLGAELDEEDEEEEPAPEIEDDLEEVPSDEPESEKLFDSVILLNEQDDNHRVVVVVPDEERVTSDIIQWSECVEAVGIRASQIENGAPVFTDVSGLSDPIDMAWKEFHDRKSPLILERHLKVTRTKRIVEHWKVAEMGFPRNMHVMNNSVTLNRMNELLQAKEK
jgi:DNA-directed RNA polymerase subunit K/omega